MAEVCGAATRVHGKAVEATWAYFEESEVDSIQSIIETVDSEVEKLAAVA